ncbi:MAG: hypothetical protein ACRDL5_14280, partial [Solirubrobacteraceae bacterium]
SSTSASASASTSASGADVAGTGATGSSTAAAGPQMGPEGVPLEQGPLLAPASTTGSATVDGIQCDRTEKLVYHIHAHLAVFNDGREYVLPYGIGIPGAVTQSTPDGPFVVSGRCFYWLHTHATDGVIHIESPSKAIYSLGDFFDVWHQTLGSTQIAGLHGKVTAFVNGRLWKRSPRDIPLLPHEDIQLEIGQPIPPIVTIDWSKTQL